MKSIMTNPKLARSFKEAMAAPIGSTKRENAKSILSIMKKVGGVQDGMGGPMPMGMGMPPPVPSPAPTAPNYGNMMIFPAAPKFKVKAEPVPTPQKMTPPNAFDDGGGPYDGAGGPYDGKGGILDSLVTNPFSFSTSPTNMYPSLSGLNLSMPTYNAGSTSGLNITGGGTPTAPTGLFSPLKLSSPNLTSSNIGSNLSFSSLSGGQTINSGLTNNGQPIMSPVPGAVTPGTTSPSGTQQYSNTALTPGQFGTTAAPVPGGTTTSGGTTKNSSISTSNSLATNPMKKGTTAPVPKSAADLLRASAQTAVNQGTGPGLFAMQTANEKFGGSLDQYIANLDAKLKVDFNLEPLEKNLSDLKAMKGNLVPTLTQYVKGKDQYLKFIDKMIDSNEDDLLKVDMSDGASVDRYNNYMNYLYTLKGRQTQRYGNFLNSAISDYNADLEKTQSNYENVYKHYSDAITRQGTIAQNEYNTLYTAMSDLYTNLEQAPIKRANLEALNLQNQANRTTILANNLKLSQTSNPDYWKDVKTYSDMITSKETGKEGTLDMTTLTSAGLAGYYNQNLLQGGDEAAMTESIRRALSKTLETSSDSATITKVKGLIKDLASNPDPAGQIFAGALNNSIAPTTSKLLSSYILGNLAKVKDATNSLVKGSSGFLWTGLGADKPGIQDKATWMKNNSALEKDFLEGLYNSINVNVGQGTSYASDPSLIIKTIFSGANDQENANNLANIISVSS